MVDIEDIYEEVEADPEAAKIEARQRIEEEIANRPPLTYEEKLEELAELYPTIVNIDVTADQFLSGIKQPDDLDFDSFMVFINECAMDLKNHVVDGKFTDIGLIRGRRYMEWSIGLPVEQRILTIRTALKNHNLPLREVGEDVWETYSHEVVKFVSVTQSHTNETIGERIAREEKEAQESETSVS